MHHCYNSKSLHPNLLLIGELFRSADLLYGKSSSFALRRVSYHITIDDLLEETIYHIEYQHIYKENILMTASTY